MSEDIMQDIPIACALSARELETRQDENAVLFKETIEIREEEQGYVFKFLGSAEQLQNMVRFISQERACCPFFTFELSFEPQNGPIWLKVSGPEGTKDFVREMMGSTSGQ